jgi:hypothetical protein
MFRLVALLVLLLRAHIALAEKKENYSLSYNEKGNNFQVEKVSDLTGHLVVGSYELNVNGSGWHYLDISVNDKLAWKMKPLDTYFTAKRGVGFLEGYVSSSQINDFYVNLVQGFFNGSSPGKQTINFLMDNYNYLKTNSEEKFLSDSYWFTIKLILLQMNGLLEGYRAGSLRNAENSMQPSALKANELMISSWLKSSGQAVTAESPFMNLDHATIAHFLLLAAYGDMFDLSAKFQESGKDAKWHSSRIYPNGKKYLVERCSALIKLLPDYSDVFFGHSLWESYGALGPRILKHYTYPLVTLNTFNLASETEGDDAEAMIVSFTPYDTYFSSSAGILSSVDDFYTIKGYGQLAVMETTIHNYNHQLLDKIVPSSVLSWTRAILANQLASSSASWINYFMQNHSGTYTNTWMVLDVNRFSKGQKPEKEFFMMVEELPEYYHAEDMTQILIDNSYWSSFNIPYFSDITELSGNNVMCKLDHNYCFATSPRFILFEQLQNNVTTIADMEYALYYNKYQTDSVSQNDSCLTIACRGDLQPNVEDQGGHGCVDGKVTSFLMFPSYTAKLGPTSDDQPVFCWSKWDQEKYYTHLGQYDCYDFAWQNFPVV